MLGTARGAARMRDLGGAPGGWRSAEMLREQRDRDTGLKTGGNRAGSGTRRGDTPVAWRAPASRPARTPSARVLPVLDAVADVPARQGWQAAIAGTVQGLGYDLVDVERAGRGLLRVTIDRIPGRVYGAPGAPDAGAFVTVEDCEAVTRQLQYVLEVEGLDYARLEVSSPGLDRPLRHDADYRRFAGQAVKITLREPFEGRKHWEGVLGIGAADGSYTLRWQQGQGERELGFALAEVREARLVPVLDFKGHRLRQAGLAARPAEAATEPTNDGAPGTTRTAPETTKG